MRQPVHTVYGGAHLFRRNIRRKLGDLALRTLASGEPDIPGWNEVRDRVREKLEREPVEDYRIDFEDGYGYRPGDEEDADAKRAGAETAAGMDDGTLPPFVGIRIKPGTRGRRTLELYLNELGGRLPPNFVVTLPKVASPGQVAELAGAWEGQLEVMVETPGAVLGLRELVQAARGRCRGAHLGAYDYTAALGIAASSQDLFHPACEFARQMMQASLAGSGVWLSDGATNVLPLGDDRQRAWRLHFDHVRRSLSLGFYQGWDLHPAQLPTRFAAVYSFFREDLEAAGARLRNFMANAAQATTVGAVFDDAATGHGLFHFFRRALDCGALSGDEAATHTGLAVDAIRRGFATA